MCPILHCGFNDWITDIFRCSINLIKLWNIKIGYDISKEFIQNLAVSLSLLMILSPSIIVIFSFEKILFDNNGLTALQNFLLSQTFFSFKLLKFSLIFSQKCYWQISLFSVSTFIFFSPILEKIVPQLCS